MFSRECNRKISYRTALNQLCLQNNNCTSSSLSSMNSLSRSWLPSARGAFMSCLLTPLNHRVATVAWIIYWREKSFWNYHHDAFEQQILDVRGQMRCHDGTIGRGYVLSYVGDLRYIAAFTDLNLSARAASWVKYRSNVHCEVTMNSSAIWQ